MRAAFYCRIGGQGYGFLLPEEADKLREFFAEHQDKPALENLQAQAKFFVVSLTYGWRKSWKRTIGDPARFSTRWSIWKTLSREMGSPVGDGNTYWLLDTID